MPNCDEEQNFNSDLNGKSRALDFCFELFESTVQAIIIVVFLMCFLLRTVNISGESMLPTLKNSDKVLIWQCGYSPKNGDVVVIRRGNKLDVPMIKRVIAVGGQTIDIDYTTGSIIVDGKKIKEGYTKERALWLKGDVELPFVVAEGYVWVMGDNRNNSTDSRFSEVGVIPYKDVVGKAVFRMFPFSRVGVIK